MGGRPPFVDTVSDSLRDARQLLRTLQASGQLDLLLSEVRAGSAASGSAGGAMHDGSKRRLDRWAHVGLEDEDFEAIPPQGPVVTTEKGAKGAESKFDLPQGVASLDQWGRTLLTLPKYQRLGLSYAQFVTAAEKEAVQGEGEKVQCLERALLQVDNKYPKPRDFSRYLHASGWKKTTQDATYFPSSSEVRRFVD